jgi:hypothetical protein
VRMSSEQSDTSYLSNWVPLYAVNPSEDMKKWS